MKECPCKKAWSKEEIELLLKTFPNGEKKTIMQVFPHRTWLSIEAKANRLRLHRPMLGEKNPQWKGDDAGLVSARERARRLYGSKKGKEIHHKDGNPHNNSPNNVEFLNRKEHMTNDGRLTNRNSSGQFIGGLSN